MITRNTDLVNELVMEMDISERAASKAVNVILEYIMDEVSKGNEVVLSGFGKFYAKEVNERTTFGVVTPAHKAPKFKAGKIFKEILS